MVRSNLTRRDFNKLAAAAFGGVVTGTMVGCGDKSDKNGGKSPEGSGDNADGAAKTDEALLLAEKHVCKGLNTCKNQGKSGVNDCRGQGTCHSAKEHTCSGDNDCKGEGGCKATAGINLCSGKGECNVPLNPETWTKVRAKFEAVWEAKNAGKTLGDAPA